MIFVTVGTHEQPFNRLIQKVDELKRDGVIKDDVIIQTGFSTYKPKYCQWSKLISYQQMVKNVADARIVITHGGPASFIMPLQIGKTPIVVPRQHQFNEHTPLFIILLIEIVLSTSSTAYAAIVLVGVIFIVNARQISLTKKCTLVFCAGIAFAVLYLQYYELLEKVLFNKWNSNSGVARRIMDNDALNAFYSSKLLGVGYKCVRGSSVLYSMLGEIGIIGTVLYTTTNAALYSLRYY